jgi:hypothetical protein
MAGAGLLLSAANQASSAPPLFTLPALSGRVLWRYDTNSASPGFNRLELHAWGERLLGTDPARPDGRHENENARAAHDTVLVNGLGSRTGPDITARLLRHLRGREWESALFDLAPAYAPRLTRYLRHLLHVEPDLFIIYDDLEAAQPVQFQLIFASAAPLGVEAKSGNFVLEQPGAGFTGHSMSSPFRVLGPWSILAPRTNGATEFSGHWRAVAAATNRLTELRLVSAFITHAAGHKRPSGFRLLESDSAIGARIYRDGLPTLIAFRKSAFSGEAEMAGLKFNDPLAVDVFRPRRQ